MPEVTPAAVATPLVVFVVLVGLAVRGRWRLSVLFAIYVASNLASGVLPYAWPQRFYSQTFWILAQASQDILKIGIVLEIVWRAFRTFPGAASVTHRAILALLGTTIVVAIAAPLAHPPVSSFTTAVEDFHPRVMDGTIWMIAATFAVAWFYRVPLHPFHRAVLTSLAIYTAFFSALLRLFGHYEFNVFRLYANVVNYIVALGICSWWAYIAWRPASTADRAYGQTLQRLQQVPSFGDRIAAHV
jgi:hypothetical protein